MRITSLFTAALLPLLAHAGAGAADYKIAELSTGDFTFARVQTLTNTGAVVGGCSSNNIAYRCYAQGGKLLSQPDFTVYSANDAGALAGHMQVQNLTKAFLLENGTATYLGPDGGQGVPWALNEQGVAAGHSFLGQGVTSASIFDHGAVTQLTLGGSMGQADDINESNAAVGWSNTAAWQQHAFLYQGGVTTDLTPDALYGRAFAINDGGAVVGDYSVAQYLTRAFIYRDGLRSDLNLTGDANSAFDINNAGFIVGATDGRAFLYQDGVATDLNTLIDPAAGLTLKEATAINDLGQIAATACTAGGDCRAVLLSPVPEPGAWIMLIGGMAVLGWRKKWCQG